MKFNRFCLMEPKLSLKTNKSFSMKINCLDPDHFLGFGMLINFNKKLLNF